jgi:nucleoside 2-deoxyribosyltransferase
MFKPSLYMAGPITGCTYDGAVNWRNLFASMLPEVNCISPMRSKAFLEQDGILGPCGQHPLTTEQGIFTRDLYDVRRCDLLIANFLNCPCVSIGTVFEIAIAYELHKPIITIMEKENIHVHPFIEAAQGFTTSSIDAAAELVRAII